MVALGLKKGYTRIAIQFTAMKIIKMELFRQKLFNNCREIFVFQFMNLLC